MSINKTNTTTYSTRSKVSALFLVAASTVGICTAKLMNNEGFAGVEAYLDVAKVWTYCYGETLKEDGTPVKRGDRATHEYCKQRLDKRTLQFMTYVARRITVPLWSDTGPYLLAGHTHFAYNIGMAGYASSQALKLTNTGNFTAGCEAMRNWNGLTVNGVKYNCNKPEYYKKINGCKGLVARRNDEIEMCLKGAK